MRLGTYDVSCRARDVSCCNCVSGGVLLGVDRGMVWCGAAKVVGGMCGMQVGTSGRRRVAGGLDGEVGWPPFFGYSVYGIHASMLRAVGSRLIRLPCLA